MVGLALLQRGTGDALCVYAAPVPRAANDVTDTTSPARMPPQALAALGPVPCVVGVNARGRETPEEIRAFAERERGRRLWWAGLIGVSRGCRKVRDLWLGGADALAVVLVDGLVAESPPSSIDAAWLETLVDRSRRGANLLVILHTYAGFGNQVTSTAAMARLATGWPLESPPAGITVRRRQVPTQRFAGWQGSLLVYSTGSGPSDELAHREQASVLLPIALAAHVRSLVDLDERPVVRIVDPPVASPMPAWKYVTREALETRLETADAGAPAAAVRAPSRRVERTTSGGVLLIGDSLAQGLWAPLAEQARSQGLPFHFKAIQGSSIQAWLSGHLLADNVLAADPALTLVCLGTNDMAAHRSGSNAEQLIRTIRRSGSGVVAWIGPPRLPMSSPAFRATLADICRSRDVRVFDSQALDLERAPDRIHMTPAGYRAWAESIATWVPFTAFAWAAPKPTRAASPSDDPRRAAPPRDAGEGRATVDAAVSLGERAARFALDEQRDGVGDSAAGSKQGPRIDQYRRGMGRSGRSVGHVGLLLLRLREPLARRGAAARLHGRRRDPRSDGALPPRRRRVPASRRRRCSVVRSHRGGARSRPGARRPAAPPARWAGRLRDDRR